MISCFLIQREGELMALKLITPPATEPISLADTKKHLRIDADITSEDSYLSDVLIPAAREYCEGFHNRAYITQTYELWLDTWPRKEYARIPRPPLQSVASVKYYGTDNAEHIMATANYFVDSKSEPGRLVLAYGKSWPSATLRPANGICVTFTAGYGAAAAVPKKAVQAMNLLIGHWFDNREAVLAGKVSTEIEFAVRSLLWLDRVVSL